MNTLVQYVRNRKNQKIGVVVATDKERLGWSLCCKTDRFDKERGLQIAIGRATKFEMKHLDSMYQYEHYKTAVPDSVRPTIIKVLKRAKVYYKEGYSHESA